jgi:dTDP-glucose 4,6-dehydratase
MGKKSGNGGILVLRYRATVSGKMKNARRAVVAGGSGFLGSHLCERLLREGCEVLCLDNLLTSSRENIIHLQSRPGFTFIHHDITQPFFLQGPVDYVLNFASPASPRDYHNYPIQTLKVGSLGTNNALGLARAKGATFLMASTSEVYGDPEMHPQRESYWGNVNSLGPRSVYDEAKRYAEAVTMAYHRVHRVRVRIARIFNTYGPRMRIDDGRVLPNFMSQAIRGEPLTMHGDGLQTRSLCYVSDLIEGIYRLLTLDTQEPVVVNLGNADEVTMRDLAQEVLEVTGSKSEIICYPLPQDDPKVRRPDISKAQQLLDWSPVVPRREGLKMVLPYFRKAVARLQAPRTASTTQPVVVPVLARP